MLRPAVLVLAVLAGPAARAQTDLQPLLDRIDRLERDVNLLQRQVYRGMTDQGTPNASAATPDTSAALSGDLRMDQLDDQMRQITGQIQDLSNQIDQLKQRLDTLSSDVDQRFAALGQGPSTAPANPGSPPPPRSSLPPVASASPGPSPGPGILGTLHSSTPPSEQEPPPGPPAAATAAELPDGSAQQQYDYAFGALRRRDPAAERLMHEFVERNPTDPLAADAQYWIGETYYSSKDYQSAATAFAIGYEKYPKSTRAAETLLQLGMSLGNLGKKQDACIAFARLDREFPSAPANVKNRESSERTQLACQ